MYVFSLGARNLKSREVRKQIKIMKIELQLMSVVKRHLQILM